MDRNEHGSGSAAVGASCDGACELSFSLIRYPRFYTWELPSHLTSHPDFLSCDFVTICVSPLQTDSFQSAEFNSFLNRNKGETIQSYFQLVWDNRIILRGRKACAKRNAQQRSVQMKQIVKPPYVFSTRHYKLNPAGALVV